jgi:hypothetical protein
VGRLPHKPAVVRFPAHEIESLVVNRRIPELVLVRKQPVLVQKNAKNNKTRKFKPPGSASPETDRIPADLRRLA